MLFAVTPAPTPLSNKLDAWARENLTRPMWREHFEARSRAKEAEPHERLLRRLLLLNSQGAPTLKEELKAKLTLWGVPHDVVTRTKLRSWYRDLSVQLTRKYSETAAARTLAELEFAEVYNQRTKHKIVFSAWIGPSNVDAFVPRFRGQNDKRAGIAWEIDGGVHDNPAKQRQDAWKDAYLSRLGIVVARVRNRAVLTKQVRVVIDDRRTRPASSSQVQDLWTEIHLATLAHWLDAPELARLIGVSRAQFDELLALVQGHEAAAKRRRAKTGPRTPIGKDMGVISTPSPITAGGPVRPSPATDARSSDWGGASVRLTTQGSTR